MRYGPRAGSGGWGEELEGNVVGVAEGQAGPVRGVDDVSVRDRELVEPLLPPLELRSIGTGKGHMVQPRSQFARRLGRLGVRVLVEAEESPVAQKPDDVVERPRILVEDGLGIKEPAVPGDAALQVAYGQSDVSDDANSEIAVLSDFHPVWWKLSLSVCIGSGRSVDQLTDGCGVTGGL